MLRRGSKLTTEQFRVAYPSWGDLLTLLGVFIVATVLGSLLTGVLQKIGSVSVGFGAFLGYVIQFSLVIIFGLFQRKIRSPKETRLLKFGLAKLDFVIILWGTIMVLATGVVIEPLLNLFPETYLDRLGNIMAAGGWMMFTSIVIAPIMEEILFRGILQDALMRKYGVFVGILIASAVFGIVHLIPQQVVNAFMIGIVLGYIYYRTGALLPVILIHCINNAISYFTWMLNGETLLSTREQKGNDTLYFTVYGIACVLFVIGFVSIAIRISKEEKRRQLEVSGGDGAQTVANASSPDSGLMTEEPLVASSVSNEKTGLNGQKTSTDHTNRVD